MAWSCVDDGGSPYIEKSKRQVGKKAQRLACAGKMRLADQSGLLASILMPQG